jgi:hypothetical protein
MFRIRKVEPLSSQWATLGRLYEIALGRWRVVLYQSPTAVPTLMSVSIRGYNPEQRTLSSVIYAWSCGGPRSRD